MGNSSSECKSQVCGFAVGDLLETAGGTVVRDELVIGGAMEWG